MGVFIFGLMWLFDRSLVTTDLIQDEHEVTLKGGVIKRDGFTRFAVIKSFFAAAWSMKGFMLRVLIALLSLYVTAPYMTQIIFKADIENGMQQRYQSEVEKYKTKIIGQLDQEIEQLEMKIDAVNDKLQQEISGGKNSRSGMYGRGPMAEAIEKELNDTKARHAQLLVEKKGVADGIEGAIKRGDYDSLRALGIRLDKDSPVFRNEVVEELKKKEAFWQTEMRVWALLIILAVILFGMKFMQPKSLRLYYSSLLQERWSLYCLGWFDPDLPEKDRSVVLLRGNDAFPDKFEELMVDFFLNRAVYEKNAEARRLREEEDRAKKLEKELAEKQALYERQMLLNGSENSHAGRVVKERHQEEKLRKDREWYQEQLTSALSELAELESAYINRHGVEIEELKSRVVTVEEKLHALDKDYKTHLERVEARKNRIQETEDELEETYELLTQTRQRDDRDRIEVLRLLEDIEQAIVRQQDRLKSQKAELLGYELEQKCMVENRERLLDALDNCRAHLKVLEEPLDKVTRERLRLEAKRMEVAADLGTVTAPYQLPDDSELPYLVEKLKADMSFMKEIDSVDDVVSFKGGEHVTSA